MSVFVRASCVRLLCFSLFINRCVVLCVSSSVVVSCLMLCVLCVCVCVCVGERTLMMRVLCLWLVSCSFDVIFVFYVCVLLCMCPRHISMVHCRTGMCVLCCLCVSSCVYVVCVSLFFVL